MNTLKRIFLAFALISLVSGCATTEQAEPVAGPSAEQVAAGDAISSAKVAVREARALNANWREAGSLLKRAEALYAEGNYDKAGNLAAQAKKSADMAVNEHYLSLARDLVKQIKEMGVSGQLATKLLAAEKMIEQGNGRWAYDLAKETLEAVKAAGTVYTVVRGDSLWRISGKNEIYGNPYQWPLIYKANADKIKDADLIYPGQDLDIDSNPSSADIGAAVRHARNRGAWSVGGVEASDRAYLGH